MILKRELVGTAGFEHLAAYIASPNPAASQSYHFDTVTLSDAHGLTPGYGGPIWAVHE